MNEAKDAVNKVLPEAKKGLPRLIEWLDHQPGYWRLVYYVIMILLLLVGGWVAIRYDLGSIPEIGGFVVMAIATLVGGLLSYAGKPPAAAALLLLLWLPQCAWFEKAAEHAKKVEHTIQSVCNGAAEFTAHCDLYKSEREEVPEPIEKACKLALEAATSDVCLIAIRTPEDSSVN